MATNLTTDNIKKLSQLDTIDVTNESDAFFLCGNGEKMQKISFNRLRKKVNGTILPTKKPDTTELGELWLQAESVGDKTKSIRFYPDLLKEKALSIFVDGVIYFLEDKKAFKMKIDKETTQTHYQSLKEKLFDGFTFDLLVFTKDLIVFFNKDDVTLSKAIKRESGEIIGLNENYSGSIPYEVLEIQNFTYPMENLNGVLFDNTDARQFQFITFELSSDGVTFDYKALATLNYSELGTVNGAKVCGMVVVLNGNYDTERSNIFIMPKIDGAYYIGDVKICEHDIKCSVVLDYTDSETEKYLYNCIFIGENQATKLLIGNGTLEPFTLYTDETTLAECVGGVQVLNGFYLLQKTRNDGVSLQKENFTLVKYFIDEDLTLKAKKIKTFTISNGQAFSISTLLKNYYGMFIDTKDALSTLDGAKENDLFICYQFADTNKYIDFLYSDYKYKMMLAYGDNVQEIQGYKGEKGDTGEIPQGQLDEAVNNAIAQVVADAPEDFNTLKEMSDWIAEHQDDASAMNTAILENAKNISTETSERKSADENLQSQIKNINFKRFGQPYGRTLYITIERTNSTLSLGNVEVYNTHAGKWYFGIHGEKPFYFGSADRGYQLYGLNGYAWEKTANNYYGRLHLKVSGYGNIGVACFGTLNFDTKDESVIIHDWTENAPEGIIFKTDMINVLGLLNKITS